MVVKGGYFKSHGITGCYFLTATIDAYEGKDIMFLDVPNKFIQTNMQPKNYGKETVIMNITGVLVDILLDPDNDM